jgi:transcriptional regulator of arginine metabolism
MQKSCIFAPQNWKFMQDKQNKKTRLQVIRMIVSSQHVEGQEELLIELDKAGFPCGQATLSRDLKQLRISNVRGRNGHSVYALPREGQFVPVPTQKEINNTKWNIRASNNLLVIHTPPGHAGMVAYDIDSTENSMILGSVAGDDTVLIILTEDADREEVIYQMQRLLPQLN